MELDKQLIRLNNQLVTRGYSVRTIRLYEQCWIHLRKVAQDMNLEEFTEELAEAFIDNRKKHSCLLYFKSGPLFGELLLKMGPLIFMLTIHD